MSRSDPLAFLGEEFLTWLWFRIETEGGEFNIGRQRELAVSFDDFIAFAPRVKLDLGAFEGSSDQCIFMIFGCAILLYLTVVFE